MTKPIILLAAIPALLLSACAGTQNRSLESVHQPVVGRTDYALDLDAGDGRLAPGEDARLDGWLRTMRVGYGDRVAIDGTRSPTANGEVAGVLARYGLLLADEAPVTGNPIAPGNLRIVVSRMRAAVPRCPDWSRNSSDDFAANTSSNYGCAINRNLAAMIANPADLVRGAPGTETTDAALSYKAIDTYRKKAPTGAGGLSASSTGGK